MSEITRVVTADGVTLVAEVAGPSAAPTVVLIGGTTQVRGMYAGVVAALSDRYRVITFDGRDVGESDRVPAGYSTEVLAGDAIAVLDAVGGGPAAFAGISLGGCVALQVGRLHPDRAWALCTGSCWARVDLHLQTQFRLWIDLMETTGFGTIFRLMSFMAFSASTQELMGDMTEMAEAVAAATDVEAFRRQVEADLGHSLTDEELGAITVPLLALWGDEDLIVPRRYAEELARAVPGAEIQGLTEVSHSMMIDHPEQLIGALRGFLERHEPAGG